MSTMSKDRGTTTGRMGGMSMAMSPMGMSMGMPGMGMSMSGMMPGMMPGMNMGMPGMGMGMGMPGMMVPRCTMTMEKMQGGMRMTCTCDDKTSAMMLQNLCNMMAGGMCSCCMMMNGMPMCCCCMSMGQCRFEMTDMGVTMTCTSGDPDATKMIQACCDCMTAMMMPGCTCCMMMNGMPMCCCTF